MTRMPPIATLFAFTLLILISLSVSAATLTCPPSLPSTHPGFEQVGPVPTAHWQLKDMRLFDGPPGEETKPAPAQLAPDGTVTHQGGHTSTWKFGGKENLLVVCAYNGSATYYRARPNPPPKLCTLRQDRGLTRGWCD